MAFLPITFSQINQQGHVSFWLITGTHQYWVIPRYLERRSVRMVSKIRCMQRLQQRWGFKKKGNLGALKVNFRLNCRTLLIYRSTTPSAFKNRGCLSTRIKSLFPFFQLALVDGISLDMVGRFLLGVAAASLLSTFTAAYPAGISKREQPDVPETPKVNLRQLEWGDINFIHTTDIHGIYLVLPSC